MMTERGGDGQLQSGKHAGQAFLHLNSALFEMFQTGVEHLLDAVEFALPRVNHFVQPPVDVVEPNGCPDRVGVKRRTT